MVTQPWSVTGTTSSNIGSYFNVWRTQVISGIVTAAAMGDLQNPTR